jgi:hypothetical protein
MLWSRKPVPKSDRARHAGLDLTASRVLGVSLGSGKVRNVGFDGPAAELALFIAMDRRTPEVGRAGYTLCRKMPHAVCSNFLPFLAQTKEWRAGRLALTPETALELAFQRVREAVAVESDAVALALPAYLAPAQVGRVTAAAARSQLPLKGTMVGPLAAVAMRSAAVATGEPAARDGVIPLRASPEVPGAVVVVDVDEHALSAVVVAVERDVVRLVTADCWPRFGMKAWKDRLLEAVSDRCVRLCRRDPRDSADAEQSLFEQLDDGLDRARAGQRISLTVRTDHWFQDVIQTPEEMAANCFALARGSAEAVRETVTDAGLAAPVRDVWLTHEAGRLPGLSQALLQHSHVGARHESLPRETVAQAAAMLVPRYLAADLPRAHLDDAIPLPPGEPRKNGASSKSAPR